MSIEDYYLYEKLKNIEKEINDLKEKTKSNKNKELKDKIEKIFKNKDFVAKKQVLSDFIKSEFNIGRTKAKNLIKYLIKKEIIFMKRGEKNIQFFYLNGGKNNG